MHGAMFSKLGLSDYCVSSNFNRHWELTLYAVTILANKDFFPRIIVLESNPEYLLYQDTTLTQIKY